MYQNPRLITISYIQITMDFFWQSINKKENLFWGNVITNINIFVRNFKKMMLDVELLIQSTSLRLNECTLMMFFRITQFDLQTKFYQTIYFLNCSFKVNPISTMGSIMPTTLLLPPPLDFQAFHQSFKVLHSSNYLSKLAL